MKRISLRLLGLTSALFGVMNLGSGAAAQSTASGDQPTAMVLECRPGALDLTPLEEAQCACEAALRANTIEALENFLLSYGEVDTQCRALASTALAQFGVNGAGNDSPPNIPPQDSGGYGR